MQIRTETQRKLVEACVIGDENKLISILRGGNDELNLEDLFLLHIACDNGYDGIVVILLTILNDLNKLDERGRSPFWISCEHGFEKIVEILKDHPDIEVNKPNNLGETPFYVACKKGRENIVSKFLDYRCIDSYFSGLHNYDCFDWEIDSKRKKFIELNVYSELFKSFLLQSNSRQEKLIPSLRKLISRGQDLRDSIKKIPNIVESFLSLIQRDSSSQQFKLHCSGIILSLQIDQKVISSVFPLLKQAIGNRFEENCKFLALDCLLQASSIEINRPTLLIHFYDSIQTYVFELNCVENFISCLIMSLIFIENVQYNHRNSVPEKISDFVVCQILQSLESFMNSNILSVPTIQGYVAPLSIILTTIRGLATNQFYLQILKRRDISSLISRLIQTRNSLFNHNQENFMELCNLVWELSFNEEIKNTLIEKRILEELKKINFGEHEGAKKAMNGVLWKLEREGNKTKKQTNEHIMISYSWAQKDGMRNIANNLKLSGLNIWIDFEQINGNMFEKISDGIERASAVIIGLSSNYFISRMCRCEAEYSFKLNKKIIFIQIEEGFQPTGWLAFLLGNQLRLNPRDLNFDTQLITIVRNINRNTSSNLQLTNTNRGSTQVHSPTIKWKTDQVVTWLEECDLRELCDLARRDNWNGSILKSLNMDINGDLRTHCANLGITSFILQDKLRGNLADLHF